jgi:hypothetical protein
MKNITPCPFSITHALMVSKIKNHVKYTRLTSTYQTRQTHQTQNLFFLSRLPTQSSDSIQRFTRLCNAASTFLISNIESSQTRNLSHSANIDSFINKTLVTPQHPRFTPTSYQARPHQVGKSSAFQLRCTTTEYLRRNGLCMAPDPPRPT